MGIDSFKEIAFPVLDVDDLVNRIYFEPGSFNLKELI